MMQVKITELTKKYPWVGMFKDEEHTTVVMFENKNEGYCLYSTYEINIESGNKYGYSWDEESFVPCEITLY